MKTRALDAYTGRNGIRYNCAQAVVSAAKTECSVADTEIEMLKAFGGGHAPGGMCGAIYAAQWLISRKSSDAAEQAVHTFCEVVGNTCCKEIRSARTYSCIDCVAEAACLVEKYLLQN